jgi:two-component system, chemotaxis family, chemotaxis protein CheY
MMAAKRILVVDDSQTLRHQVRQALSPRGYELIEAVDGVEGLTKIRENPDLSVVLCDINMPNMTGLEMLAVVRAEGLSTPIIMLTSEGQPSVIRRAREMGAKGWIVKPFNVDLLVSAINKLTTPTSVTKP